MKTIVLSLTATLLLSAAIYGWVKYQHVERERFCFDHYEKQTDGTDEFVNTTMRCIDDGFIPAEYR